MSPVMVDGRNLHRRMPDVSPGIIGYSFIDLGRMKGRVGPAAREDLEI